MTTIELSPLDMLDLYREVQSGNASPAAQLVAAKVDFDEPYFIVGYSVGRAYGGPEEGGWWFDVLEPLEDCVIQLPPETIAVQDEDGLRRTIDHFAKMWRREHAYGDIKSVLGGQEVAVFLEQGEPGQHATTEYPRYE